MKAKSDCQRTERIVRLSKGSRKSSVKVLGPVVDPDPRVVVDLSEDSGDRCSSLPSLLRRHLGQGRVKGGTLCRADETWFGVGTVSSTDTRDTR